MAPQAQIRRQTGEYESLVPPRIAEWAPVVDAELSRDVEEATLALREFDLHTAAKLGTDSPALGPMSAILLRTESASSSQIEQLTTSARQLALAELEESVKVNANTVLRNVRAMEAALLLASRLDSPAILAMHSELLRNDFTLSDEAGRFRRELVWVGGDDAGPRGAQLIAPQPELVEDAVNDVVAFMDRDDIGTLVKTAISHAQFETIHPFVDGNGRTGRAIAQSLLRRDGITVNTTVPLSAGLLTDIPSYFDALTHYREGDAAPIIRRFCSAARFAARTGRALVDSLAHELAEARSRLSGVRSDSKAHVVLDALVGQPVVNSAYLRTHLRITEQSAHRALATLTERGVLTERTGHSRNRVWAHAGILSALDDYAERARRGSRAG